MKTVLLQINDIKAYQLIKDLDNLSIVKVLKKTGPADRKKSAHKFSGLISKTDIDLMDKAIEEDCETIDFDCWK